MVSAKFYKLNFILKTIIHPSGKVNNQVILDKKTEKVSTRKDFSKKIQKNKTRRVVKVITFFVSSS